jgi:methylglutaconyl-CoA hydratase
MSSAAVHQLFLTGLTVDAQWAEQAGLVDVVAEPDLLDVEVDRITDAFARAAPGALAATKRLTRSPAVIARLQTELAELEALSVQYFASAEGREGLTAFAEKRSPSRVP